MAKKIMQPPTKKPVVKNNNSNTTIVKGSRPKIGVFKTEKSRTTNGGILEPYKYKTTSIDTTGYSKGKRSYNVVNTEGVGDKSGIKVTKKSSKTISKSQVPSTLKKLK
jgi:hypothetical protein